MSELIPNLPAVMHGTDCHFELSSQAQSMKPLSTQRIRDLNPRLLTPTAKERFERCVGVTPRNIHALSHAEFKLRVPGEKATNDFGFGLERVECDADGHGMQL